MLLLLCVDACVRSYCSGGRLEKVELKPWTKNKFQNSVGSALGRFYFRDISTNILCTFSTEHKIFSHLCWFAFGFDYLLFFKTRHGWWNVENLKHSALQQWQLNLTRIAVSWCKPGKFFSVDESCVSHFTKTYVNKTVWFTTVCVASVKKIRQLKFCVRQIFFNVE